MTDCPTNASGCSQQKTARAARGSSAGLAARGGTHDEDLILVIRRFGCFNCVPFRLAWPFSPVWPFLRAGFESPASLDSLKRPFPLSCPFSVWETPLASTGPFFSAFAWPLLTLSLGEGADSPVWLSAGLFIGTLLNEGPGAIGRSRAAAVRERGTKPLPYGRGPARSSFFYRSVIVSSGKHWRTTRDSGAYVAPALPRAVAAFSVAPHSFRMGRIAEDAVQPPKPLSQGCRR